MTIEDREILNAPVTEHEHGLIQVMRLNRLLHIPSLSDLRWKWGLVSFRYEHRSKNGLWGRFGAGWQWNVGIGAGALHRTHGCIIIYMLVSMLRISWDIREQPK